MPVSSTDAFEGSCTEELTNTLGPQLRFMYTWSQPPSVSTYSSRDMLPLFVHSCAPQTAHLTSKVPVTFTTLAPRLSWELPKPPHLSLRAYGPYAEIADPGAQGGMIDQFSWTVSSSA